MFLRCDELMSWRDAKWLVMTSLGTYWGMVACYLPRYLPTRLAWRLGTYLRY